MFCYSQKIELEEEQLQRKMFPRNRVFERWREERKVGRDKRKLSLRHGAKKGCSLS